MTDILFYADTIQDHCFQHPQARQEMCPGGTAPATVPYGLHLANRHLEPQAFYHKLRFKEPITGFQVQRTGRPARQKFRGPVYIPIWAPEKQLEQPEVNVSLNLAPHRLAAYDAHRHCEFATLRAHTFEQTDDGLRVGLTIGMRPAKHLTTRTRQPRKDPASVPLVLL